MNIELFREFCLSLPGVEEAMPFDDKTLVFKVMGKIFALTNIESYRFINLKCEPAKAEKLREEYAPAVTPGYHMNKKHWNSVQPDNDLISPDLLKEWISLSYDLVVQKLPKKLRESLPKK